MHPDIQILPLSYRSDSADWFAKLRHLPRALWLDSCHPGSPYGRYDILAAAPLCELQTRGLISDFSTAGHSWSSTEDPFALLDRLLDKIAVSGVPELPFYGGALGYFGYDLGRRLESLPNSAVQDIELPEMSIGIYPWAIIQDHQRQSAWLVLNYALTGGGQCAPYNFSDIRQLCCPEAGKPEFHDLKQILKSEEYPFKINDFKSNIKVESYQFALEKIHEYILAGDCYQVNFAQRFSADFRGDPLHAYLALRERLPSPFAGFMQLDHGAVICLSPERFIRVQGRAVETKPIKGTIRRGSTQEEDTANASWLAASEKNRAENLMIVDLLRNDLSKHCNQVRVPGFCELQSFANVHHLVSTVTAELRPGASPLDVLRDAFPGGSITGAPKIRAMEIIEELEPSRRSLYCGSLGYISCDGQLDTNIAIRTLVCNDQKIHCWGGGGIVADSDSASEYQESLAKVQVLMDSLMQQFGKS